MLKLLLPFTGLSLLGQIREVSSGTLAFVYIFPPFKGYGWTYTSYFTTMPVAPRLQKPCSSKPLRQSASLILKSCKLQAIGTGFKSVKYLAPYVFKVAISNTRIVKVEDRIVSFRYKKVKSNRWRTCRLDVMEFIRRFLQHVLPTGFMKVRYYGFLHPSSSIRLETIRITIEAANGAKVVKIQITITKYVPTCPDCGGELEYLYSVLPYMIPPKQPG